MINNARGFALIESVATLLFIATALSGALATTYIAFAHLWLKHAAYETSICLSTPETTFRCESQLRKQTALALPIGQLSNVVLSRYQSDVETRFHWQFSKDIAIAVEDIRPVPLLGVSDGESYADAMKRRFP